MKSRPDSRHDSPLRAGDELGPATPRDRLAAAATELFTSHGYASTSVREIVEKAGVTKPALYYHFGSKEGIYLEILKGLERLFGEALDELATAEGGARERIDRLFLGLYGLFEENTTAVRFLNAIFWGPPQGAPPFDLAAFHLRFMGVVRRIVEEGMASGELRRAVPEDVAAALIGLFSFSMDLQLAHPELGLGKAGLGRVLELVFSGVGAAAPSPSHQEITR